MPANRPVGVMRPMRRMLAVFVPIVMLVMATGACDAVGVRGSGAMAVESREVSGFTAIDLNGSGTVLVSVAETESLRIDAEDNILPLLTSEVRDDTLVLGAKQSISPTRDIVYTVTVISLEGVEVSGSGSVTAVDVDASRFTVDISGSGTVIPTGDAEDLDLAISGSGTFDGDDLAATTGTVSISGSGSAVVSVSDRLDVDVSGSGTVVYIGDPDVSSSISGSGEVTRR